jgi:hypothetical protein
MKYLILTSYNCNLQDIVQEQITRVLLERLIVNRPHPWGLLITFVELIKVCYHDCLKEFLAGNSSNTGLYSVEPTVQLLGSTLYTLCARD